METDHKVYVREVGSVGTAGVVAFLSGIADVAEVLNPILALVATSLSCVWIVLRIRSERRKRKG